MSGNTLDIENHAQLASYLRQRDPACEPVHMQTLAGGVSNRTVLVRFADGQQWVVKQALAKLRTKADWFSDPARVHREALGIQWLDKLIPSVPKFIFEDFENHLLAMQAVPEPHENWKTVLMSGRIDVRLVEQFAVLLASIHLHSAQRNAQWKLAEIFDDRSFFESLRLEPYYAYSAQQVPQAAEFLHHLIDQTRQRRFALVHGDYSPKNFLVDGDRRMWLLDHEVIHWGDPTFDLGFALAHLLGKAHHFRDTRYLAAVEQFWNDYQQVAGKQHFGFERMVVRQALGCSLARVAGRSPLEYLTDPQRDAQRQAVVEIIPDPPGELMEMKDMLCKKLGVSAWR